MFLTPGPAHRDAHRSCPTTGVASGLPAVSRRPSICLSARQCSWPQRAGARPRGDCQQYAGLSAEAVLCHRSTFPWRPGRRPRSVAALDGRLTGLARACSHYGRASLTRIAFLASGRPVVAQRSGWRLAGLITYPLQQACLMPVSFMYRGRIGGFGRIFSMSHRSDAPECRRPAAARTGLGKHGRLCWRAWRGPGRRRDAAGPRGSPAPAARPPGPGPARR